MEFDFDLKNLLGDQELFLIDKRALNLLQRKSLTRLENASCVLDKLGKASAKAQLLPAVITGASKLSYSDHRVYVLSDLTCQPSAVVGFIKVGRKSLFLYDHHGKQHEMSPLCVLDFYVHETRQRKGNGKTLFEHMVAEEGYKACHLAIDKPSSKFLHFLKKHYDLKATIAQVNNFVIFEGFFSNNPAFDNNNRRSDNNQIRQLRAPPQYGSLDNMRGARSRLFKEPPGTGAPSLKEEEHLYDVPLSNVCMDRGGGNSQHQHFANPSSSVLSRDTGHRSHSVKATLYSRHAVVSPSVPSDYTEIVRTRETNMPSLNQPMSIHNRGLESLIPRSPPNRSQRAGEIDRNISDKQTHQHPVMMGLLPGQRNAALRSRLSGYPAERNLPGDATASNGDTSKGSSVYAGVHSSSQPYSLETTPTNNSMKPKPGLNDSMKPKPGLNCSKQRTRTLDEDWMKTFHGKGHQRLDTRWNVFGVLPPTGHARPSRPY